MTCGYLPTETMDEIDGQDLKSTVENRVKWRVFA